MSNRFLRQNLSIVSSEDNNQQEKTCQTIVRQAKKNQVRKTKDFEIFILTRN